MAKLKTVRINRKKWARGLSESINKLLLRPSDLQGHDEVVEDNPTLKIGNMCCLGFACLAIGASKSAIAGKAMPDEVYRTRILEGLSYHSEYSGRSSTDFAQEAAELNDDATITNQQRERKLTKLSRQHGFNFVFFGRTK